MSSFSLEPNLLNVEFNVALFSNTAPSGFHSVPFFFSLRNESDRKDFPLHPHCVLHTEDLKLCLCSSDLNGLLTQLGYAY